VSRAEITASLNGIGETTLFDLVVEPDRSGMPLVNADRIAAQRWPGSALEHSCEAASISLKPSPAPPPVDGRLPGASSGNAHHTQVDE
jgi:hypothetical protein